MVHPASGYLVGSLLRRAPALARELGDAIRSNPELGSSSLAKRGWQILWTPELVKRHRLYQFGLQRLMSFGRFKNFLVKAEILLGRIIPTEIHSHSIIYQAFQDNLIYKILKCFLESLLAGFLII